MASNRRKNKIDVALELQQKTIEKLAQFNQDFDNSVTRLGKMLEGVSGQLGGSGGGGAGLSPNASTAEGTDQMFANTQKARTPGAEDSVEQQMIKFTRRVGGETAIPVGFRQTLGYMAEGQLSAPDFSNMWKPGQITPGMSPEQIGRLQADQALFEQSRVRYRAQRANDVLFQMQAVKANTMLAMNKYSGFFGDVANIGNAGYATNAQDSRRGILGSMLFSPAFFHGLSESVWKPGLSSWFGLDPSYGFGAAQAARRAINQYGWSGGNQGDWLAGILKTNTVNYGLDPQTQMQFLDPMLRWGGDPFSRIMATLQQIPQAATAAGYNLNQFTQELVQTATAVAQATGQPIGQVASTISSISAATGLAPQQVGAMDTFQNQLFAAGLSGKSLGSVVLGNNGQTLLKRPLMLLNETLAGQGYSIQKWIHDYYHGTAAEKRRAENAYAYGPYAFFNSPGGKEAFGGMSPMQLIHMLGQSGSAHALMSQSHILEMLSNPQDLEKGARTPAQFDRNVEKLIREYFPGNKSRTDAILRQYEEKAKFIAHPGNRADLAKQLLEAYQPYDRRRFGNMTLGLTPQAAQLVSLMKQDAAHANAQAAIGRYASPPAAAYGGK